MTIQTLPFTKIMKSITFAILFLSGSVICSPHRHLHHHAARHTNQEEEKPVVWVTEVAVKTVQVTTTVWVTPLAEPTPVAEPIPALVESPAAEENVSTPNVPAQFFESQSPTDEDTPPSGTPTEKIKFPSRFIEPQPSTDKDSSPIETLPEKSVHSSKSSDPQPPTNEDIPSPEVASGKSDSSHDQTTVESPPIEPVNQAQLNPSENNEAKEPSSVEVEASEPSTPPEPLTASTLMSTESSPGSNITAIHDHATAATCSPSSPCNGDITYYDPGVGYGACGWKNSKNEPVVALPHEFMGPRSNGNSYCGKTITIVKDGKKSTARVVDKCMGCTGFSLDLSDAVFTQLASLSVGRASVKWWVN